MASSDQASVPPVPPSRGLKFYGVNDLSSPYEAPRAVAILVRFAAGEAPDGALAHIELFNACRFVDEGFFPRDLSAAERSDLELASASARSAVARFFTELGEHNLNLIETVPFEYHVDLIDLLSRNRAFDRCPASAMLSALQDTGVNTATMLGDRRLVRAYDQEVRELVLDDDSSAELLIRALLGRDGSHRHHLPRSLTPADIRALLEKYVNSPGANFNLIDLVATAPISGSTGIDARLKLAAQRRSAAATEEFFKANAGIESGTAVVARRDQSEPVIVSYDGTTVEHAYSHDWLEATTDHASVLNHFQHLFDFANRDVLLTLPAYYSELAVVERFLTTIGRFDRKVSRRVRQIPSGGLYEGLL